MSSAAHAECRVEGGCGADGAGLRDRREGGRGARDGRGTRWRRARGRRHARRASGWRSLGDLAGRSGASAETLGRLAWAGACDALVDGEPSTRRRRALWTLGVAVPGIQVAAGTQLALPLDPHEGPELRALSAWERMLADYGSTGVTLARAPARADATRPPARPQHEQRTSRPTRTPAACEWPAS